MIQRPLNTPAQDIAFNIEESLLKMTNCFKYFTVENESTLFTGRVHSSGMESGRPRADFWCERTDAEYIRHMHTKHKL